MNGGFTRWQSQHLRKLRIPNIKAIGFDIANKLVKSYDQRDFASINKYVNDLYESARFIKKDVYCGNNGQMILNLAV
jgi:hypothetical protein